MPSPFLSVSLSCSHAKDLSASFYHQKRISSSLLARRLRHLQTTSSTSRASVGLVADILDGNPSRAFAVSAMPYSSVRSDEDSDGSFGFNQIIEPLASSPDRNTDQGEDGSMWVPFFLRPTTLLAFSASLMTIGLSLGILAWYSGQNQGICAAGDRQYYAWTYGPTAGE